MDAFRTKMMYKIIMEVTSKETLNLKFVPANKCANMNLR